MHLWLILNYVLSCENRYCSHFQKSAKISQKALWNNFFEYYLKAYKIAFSS